MAISIVNMLSKELHDIRKQVERVTDLETASNSTDTLLFALEADQQALRHHLIDVQLHNRQNNMHPRGIPEATMGADLRITVVAILNQLMGNTPTVEFVLDRVQRVQGTHAPLSSQVASSSATPPFDILCRVYFFAINEEILHHYL